jgi:heat-inducible transcriptional repressor
MAAQSRRVSPADRESEILRDVIHTFISSGEPVSSRAVAKLERHGLSSASIRSVMADLEDQGFLAQPYKSAGRVPTATGYHCYIDSLMPSKEISGPDRRLIEAELQSVLSDVEKLMEVVTHLLTQLSNQIGIVVTPPVGETVLKAINFIKLSERRALCVMVSVGGLVENRVIETLHDMSREELVRISNFLTESCSGLTLRQIRDRLLGLMAQERAELDELLADAVDLAQQTLGADDGPGLLVEGTEVVLRRPELSDIPRVRRLIETFTDKADLVRMVSQLIGGEGVRVIIGEDSDLTSDLDFSLVATTYGPKEHALGSLGIFGPSRMDYQKVVPLVSYLGTSLGQALRASTEGETEE